MYLKILSKTFTFVLIVGVLFSTTIPLTALAQPPDPPRSEAVDPQVLAEIEENGSTSYWIDFESTPDLDKAYAMDWSERGWYVYDQLSKAANAAQANVTQYLNDAGVTYESFWIKNTILVTRSDLVVLNGMLGFQEVQYIRPLKNYILYEPDTSSAVLGNSVNAIEPNISQVNADDVWALGYTGEGMVVASIDTGVRYTHDALTEQYRGNDGGTYDHNYNWWDGLEVFDVPTDPHSHGTHTMGTMIGDDGGDNQIGMAPGAEWMACRGCSTSSCPDFALLSCAQFMAAPTTLEGTDPDPDMRPNVINNSWGGCSQSYNDWYQAVVDAWHAAGIYPVFSNGNAGNCGYSYPPGLNTVGNPARYGNVTGVGASGTNNGEYAIFSNWGPTDNPDTVNPTDGFDTMKPQVLAPGTSIRSSIPDSDSSYEDGWSGTSMAAPHVTGLVALIWQAAPCLLGDYAATENLIEETAVDITYDDGSEDTPTNFPNFATGWGEIDALAAVEAAVGFCGYSSLEGTVTDSVSTEPIEGAKVEITGTDPANDRIVATNEVGYYTTSVNEDTYTIAVSELGFGPEIQTDIVVTSGSTETVDFTLDPLDAAMVSGTVYDGGTESGPSHGYPLYASLTFAAPGFYETIFTDPFTGAYEIELYLSQEYAVTVEAVPTGYETLTTTFTPELHQDTHNFNLYVDAGACAAPGFMDTGAYLVEGFETRQLPTDWTNYNYSSTGEVWQFNDPYTIGNLTPGGDGGFAILNIEDICFGGFHNVGLRTPVMDFSGETVVLLAFDTDYNNLSNDAAAVRISSDNGINWIPVWEQTEGFNGHVSLDISTEVAGYSEVIVEFYYQGSWATWWEVDDVYIGEPSCDPIPGGVVAGFVFDDSSQDVLIGADVVSADVAVQTLERSSDPENAGLYWAFQPITTDPEDVVFTASMVNCLDDSAVVSVVQDEVTQQDFFLGTGHLLFDPTGFEVTMGLEDAPVEEVMTISNDGSGAANFELFEIDNGFELSVSLPEATIRKQAALNENLQITAAGTKEGDTKQFPANSMPNADIELILDDGSAENNIGIGDTWEFIFLNQFTPGAGAFPFTLDEIQVYFDDTVNAGDEIILAVYENTSSSEDPAVGANLLASFPETVQTTSSWNNYTLPGGVLLSGPGDVLIGVVALEVPGTEYHPAAIDQTTSQERSWAGWWLTSPPPTDLALPPDNVWGLMDGFGFPGNFLIRGKGVLGGGDKIWLSEDPVSGTVDASDYVEVTLTFDPSMLEQPGDYYAELQAQHDTPDVYDNIPVTLHVLRPETWGTILGTISVLEACDVNPTPVEGAAVNIYDAERTLVASLTSGMDGGYSWSLIAGTYDIEIMLDGYETLLVEDVVVMADLDMITDLDLRLLAPCLSVVPESEEQWLDTDQTAMKTLSLINSGAGDAGFEILESETMTPTVILSEGFEGGVLPPAGGWETIHKGDTIREWTLIDEVTYPEYVFDGDYAGWINFDYPAESDEWLLSPIVDVSEMVNLELSFLAISDTLNPGATMKLWVTDESGTPLTVEPIWDLIRNENWSSIEYRQMIFDLSDFDGYGNVRIAWQYVCVDGQSFGLDLVKLTGSKNIFNVFDAPLTGKTQSDSYSPEYDVPGANQLKHATEIAGGGNLENETMDILIDEGFEDAFPPLGWSQEITNSSATWEQNDYSPHSGTYKTRVQYDYGQDEWLLTPEYDLSEGTLSVWSFGNLYWCRDTYDNCDLNVWLVVGDVGGGDDIFVKNLDEDWVATRTWAQSTIDLGPYLPGSPVKIGFQYIGDNGAEAGIDDISLDGVQGEANDIPWLSEEPILGSIPADSSLDVDVTFDSTGLAYGDYNGLLKVENAPNPVINVPVALHVIPAPEAFDQSVTTPEDTPIEITLTAADPEGDPLTYSIVDGPSYGTLAYAEGELPVLTYVPENDYYGEDSFTFKANDGVIDSNIATVSIEVTPVNYPPQANDDYYEADENVELIISAPGVLENDVELDPLDVITADLVDEPAHGTVTLNEDGSFNYMPDAGFLGEDRFRQKC